MEIRINVEDEFMESLRKKMSEPRATEVTRDALSLLSWAVNEAREGRVILSAQRDGSDVHKLAMPALEKVSPRAGKAG